MTVYNSGLYKPPQTFDSWTGQPSGNRGISIGSIGNALGDAFESAVDYVGNSLDANAANAMAIAQLNAANAAAVTEEQARKTQTQKDVMKIVLFAVISVTLITLAYVLKPK